MYPVRKQAYRLNGVLCAVFLFLMPAIMASGNVPLLFLAVGIAAPGQVDCLQGRIRRYDLLPDFLDVPVRAHFQKAVKQAVGDMLDRFFGGSADSLVLALVETRRLTPEKLARIQKLLEQPREVKHGND